MRKNTSTLILFFVFALYSFYFSAQDTPPSNGVFRIQNVATQKFLTDAGKSATPVTMSDSGENGNTHFRFVKSGAYYNIDSETFGIIRAVGTGAVVSTSKKSPAADTDKTWTIYHNETNDTYRFESRGNKFIYHEQDGTVTHKVVASLDDRSNWKLIPYIQTPVEVAPDEDTSSDLTCPSSGEFENNNTRNVDITNSVNVGTADDRSCYSDYSEVDLYGKTWGVYNITDGSNHWDPNTLQPRIERSLPRSGETGVGSFARFKGVFRILEVGEKGSFSQNGTYIAQAKGKHSGGGGSNDPAICLYRAHAVYGTGINEGKQVAFDIYAERILERGGEGSGREVVLLTRVNKNEEVDFELEVGFRQDPNDPTKKIHYCDAIIGGEAFNYNIPEPERGLESGIRYGVYRVRGGRGQIRWANTTYEKKELKDITPVPDVDKKIYNLKNVATGKYLTDAGQSAQPVKMSDTGASQNTHWTLVKSGDFFNIDSETFGILRGPGENSSAGAYVVLSTGKSSPANDNDKVWTIHYNDSDDTYRFESKTSGRFLYHEENGNVTHIKVSETDIRSKWKAVLVESLGLTGSELNLLSVKVYPNPVDDKFIITLDGFINPRVKISNVLGKVVYQTNTVKEKIELSKLDGFTSGVYLIQVVGENGLKANRKLLVK